MTEQKPDSVDLDEDALSGFAARLAAFAQDLDERDRAALDAILLRARWSHSSGSTGATKTTC